MLETDFHIYIDDLGILVNRIDVRKNEAQDMLAWFEQAFEEMPIWQVRDRAQIQRAFSNGHSIFAAEKECDQAEAFLAVADHLSEYFDLPAQEVSA